MNKFVLITGATGGIGKALAHVYSKNGYNLVLVSTNTNKVHELSKELESTYGNVIYSYVTDLSDEYSYKNLYEYVKELNINLKIVINNAGFGDFNIFNESDLDKINEMIKVNITALTNLTYYFINYFLDKNKKGKIVNVGSIASFFSGPYLATYYASKNYVLSFSEGVDKEVKKKGIRVLTLCPGTTKTNFENKANLDNSKLFKTLKPKTPESLAKYAYKKIKRGKSVIIHGTLNKTLIVLSKFAPRKLVTFIISKIQSKRKNQKNAQ